MPDVDVGEFLVDLKRPSSYALSVRCLYSQARYISSIGARLRLTVTILAIKSWADIPVAVLQAELQRRQDRPEKPECGTKGRRGSYNTSLHVFALVLILVLSTLGRRSYS